MKRMILFLTVSVRLLSLCGCANSADRPEPEQMVRADAAQGEQVFYPIYTEEETNADPSKRDTGLLFFRGEPGEKFAVVNTGGGFMYVGAMHDSFPHALELSKMGYNVFALIYRPDDPYTGLAQAIAHIYDHADELQVNPEGYSLWGGNRFAPQDSASRTEVATIPISGPTPSRRGRWIWPGRCASSAPMRGSTVSTKKTSPWRR